MNINTETKVRVIALLDGRPGHEKQTMGIVRALQQMAKVRLTCVTLRKRPPFVDLLHTCALFLPGVTVREPWLNLENGDLVIGTGRRTHLSLLLHKKRYGSRAVTCMSPAAHLRRLFDICFIPEHDGLKAAGNVVHTVGPPNMSTNRRKHRRDRGLILLGGVDRKSHFWDSAGVVEMIEKVVRGDRLMSWTVSSSPRTPDETVASLHNLVSRYERLRFYDYRDTESGWVERQYDQSSAVWVTSDSISMIYEALSAGCTVGIFPVQWRRRNCKFRRNETMLIAKGLVKTFSESGLLGVGRDESSELNEAQRCAMTILRKWWPNSLQ